MIQLSLMEAAVVIVGLAMVAVVFFSWVARWTAQNAERRSLRHRIVCRLCLAVFENNGREQEIECPHCGAKTNRGGPQALG